MSMCKNSRSTKTRSRYSFYPLARVLNDAKRFFLVTHFARSRFRQKNIKKWAKLEKNTSYASFELGASREQMSERYYHDTGDEYIKLYYHNTGDEYIKNHTRFKP